MFKKNFLVFGCLANLLLQPSVFAQVGPDPNYTDEGAEGTDIEGEGEGEGENEADERLRRVPLPENDDAYLEDAFKMGDKDEYDKKEDDELKQGKSGANIRREFSYGVGAHFGVAQAWQKYNLNFSYLANSSLAIITDLGAGDHEFRGERIKKSYELKVKAKSLVVGARYYFMDLVSAYVQPGVGYMFLKGALDPAGSDENEDDDSLSDKLRASFSASGLALSIKLGATAFWENGFFIDYCIVGGSKTWMLNSSYTHASSEAKSATKHELQEPTIWGLVNIGLGKLF